MSEWFLDASLIDKKTSIQTVKRKTGDICTVSGKIVSGMASASRRTDIANAGPMRQKDRHTEQHINNVLACQ
jgi:hypothetical protein